MSNKVEDESLDLINDILSETDPEFVKELEVIDPEVLNGKEITNITDETLLPKSFKDRYWSDKNKSSKVMLLLSGFLVGVGLPLLMMTYFGWFTLSPGDFSFEKIQSETLTLAPEEGTENLYRLFPVVIYTLEIPEKVYPLKSSGKADFGRFSFYLEFDSAADAEAYESRRDHVVEIIFNKLRNTTSEEWSGIEGKEKIRNDLLTAINRSMPVRVRMIRFKNIHL